MAAPLTLFSMRTSQASLVCHVAETTTCSGARIPSVPSMATTPTLEWWMSQPHLWVDMCYALHQVGCSMPLPHPHREGRLKEESSKGRMRRKTGGEKEEKATLLPNSAQMLHCLPHCISPSIYVYAYSNTVHTVPWLTSAIS